MDANEFLFGKRLDRVHKLPCGHYKSPWDDYFPYGVVVSRAGVKLLRRCCPRCQRPVNGVNLPHNRVPNIDAIPIVQDNRDGSRCEVCGSDDGVEYHHWAPSHLFGWEESAMWPGADLCRYCHQRWHRITETGMWWKKRSTSQIENA